MRILTVRQPWALHILQSGKDVENRPRNIVGAYRGPVAIHAGLQMDDDAMRRLPMRAPDDVPRHFWTGQILGVVDVVGVHHADACHGGLYMRPASRPYSDTFRSFTRLPAPGERLCSSWAMSNHWHIELANPHRLTHPIPYKGALGLRTLPADVVATILSEVQS